MQQDAGKYTKIQQDIYILFTVSNCLLLLFHRRKYMKRTVRSFVPLIMLIWLAAVYAEELKFETDRKLLDLSLLPPVVNTSPGPEYASETRLWQGIPGIERTAGGRLWTVWYSGGKGEGPDNYVVVITSDDDGRTWSKPKLVIDPQGKVRAYDPVLWHDPIGRLWLFWAQSYDWFDGRSGTWSIR